MPIPKLRRVNTIGIRYIRGERRREEYDKILADHLGLDDDEILRIGEVNNKRFLVKLDSAETYSRIIDGFSGQPQVIEEDLIVVIDDVCSYQTKVTVRQVPFEVSKDDLYKIFVIYGRISTLRGYNCRRQIPGLAIFRFFCIYGCHNTRSKLSVLQRHTDICISFLP